MSIAGKPGRTPLTIREELGAASGTKRATSCVLISYVVLCRLTIHSDSRSIQAKRSAGATKAAVSEEDLKEWKESLEEVMGEVKKLDFGVKAY